MWLLAVLDRREATRVAQTRLGLATYQQLNQLVVSATASQVKGCELLRHSAVCDVRICSGVKQHSSAPSISKQSSDMQQGPAERMQGLL